MTRRLSPPQQAGTLRRACLAVALLTCALLATGAGAASASTYFVNGATGADTNACSSASAPCKTIKAAVAKSEIAPDGVRIEVAAGEYVETLALESYGDTNLTITGTGSGAGGTTLVGENGTATVRGAPLNAGTTTLGDMRIVNPPSDASPAVEFVETPLALNDVAVDMQDAASTATALIVKEATANMSAVSVGGAWTGLALHQEGSGNITGSTFVANGAAIQLGAGLPYGGDDVLIQDSKVQASSTSGVGIETSGVDLVVDSSLLLGGNPYGIEWLHPLQRQRIMTIAGSTIDAGALGVSDAGVKDIYADVNSAPGAAGFIHVQGSILFEPQTAAIAGAQDQLTLGCAYSDVPSQTQSGDASSTGTIECASGTNGNLGTPAASLLVDPGSDYRLLPGTPAIDAVPAGALTLPFGLASATSDLAGDPRVADGNGDCLAVQDMGAFELQGHGATCPREVCPVNLPRTPHASCPPLPTGPKPVISHLKISPNRFRAAPSGASISKRRRTKQHYGATISYSDSQAAATTFYVSAKGFTRACGAGNARTAAHCFLLSKKSFGQFTHRDRAGTNRLHFSGRMQGKKLPKGRYLLSAIPRGKIGAGPVVTREFTID